MRVRRLTAYLVRLPLKRRISHASATRTESENLVVRCDLDNGGTGWGEGVPRSYVTGETPEGALSQLAHTPLGELLQEDCDDWSQVLAMCRRFEPAATGDDPRGCRGNALRCAVELSLLDAFGRQFGEPVSAVTQHFESGRSLFQSRDAVFYSGAVTADTRRKEVISAIKMRVFGFRQCKVKVGVAADDARRLKRIRRWLGPRMDLRIDANEAWSAENAAEKIEQLAAFNISCVEQPVPHEQVASLADLRQRVSVPIMLDESLTGPLDADAAIRGRTCDVFNLRLSKCGGFLRCLELAALARRHGLAYQLGCHPGESGILSAAGRHWATTVADIRYLEGSYDRYLLRRLLTNEDVSFSYGGRGEALKGPGLGVTVNETALKELTVKSQVFAW